MNRAMINKSYKTSVILVLLAGVAWSTMGLAIRSLEEAQTWQILFYRSLAMVPVLFLFIAHTSQGKQVRKAGIPAVIGAIGLVFAFAGAIFAIQSTSVANAVFLFATAPFFTAILGWILLSEPVRRATWKALAIAAVGVVIMVKEGLAAGALAGNIAAILSALGFAVFTISLRWGKLGDMLPAVLLSGVFALIFSATMCIILGQTLVLGWWDTGVAMFMGVFQLGFGLVMYTMGSKAIPATELALLSMTEVLLGPFWVWLFLGETASAWTFAGGLILMVAIAGNALAGVRHKPPMIM